MSEKGDQLSSPAAGDFVLARELSRYVVACQAVFRRVLPRLLAGLFAKLDEALSDLADKCESNRLYVAYLDASQILRERSGDVESLFLREFLRSGAELVRGRAVGLPEPYPAGGMEGSGVLAEELEESLAIGNLISKAENRYQRELVELRGHLATMLGQESVDGRIDPIGPHVLCNAFKSALEPFEGVDLAIKLVIYKQFDKQVMDHLGDLYAGCTEQARNAASGAPGRLQLRIGSGADLPPSERVHESSGGNSNGELRPGTGYAGSPPASLDLVSFEGLRKFLVRRRPRLRMRRDTGVVQTFELISVLSELQLASRSSGLGATAATDLRRRLSDELKIGRGERPSRILGQVDEDTLDLVELLFEHLLQANELPDAIRALIGRLQIPILKVALLDKSFFENKQHPARCLLNHLAQIAVGWTDDGDRSAEGIYVGVEQVVEHILANFDRDLAVFEQLDAKLAVHVSKELDVAQTVESQTHRELEGRARLQGVRQTVEAAIAERIKHYGHVPETVSALLYEGWAEVMVAAYLRGGVAGDEWRAAEMTVDRLLWSVQPKVGHDERRDLLRSVPELLRTLRESLAQVFYDKRRLASRFRELQALHMAALRSSAPALTDTPAAARDAGGRAGSLSERGGRERADRLRSLHQVPALEAVDTTTGTPRKPSAGQGARGLSPGTWVEVKPDDGSLLRVKLMWHGTDSDTYLFVDRGGRKALELAGADLDRMQAQGALSVLGNGRMPFVDRAIEAMLHSLNSA